MIRRQRSVRCKIVLQFNSRSNKPRHSGFADRPITLQPPLRPHRPYATTPITSPPTLQLSSTDRILSHLQRSRDFEIISGFCWKSVSADFRNHSGLGYNFLAVERAEFCLYIVVSPLV